MDVCGHFFISYNIKFCRIVECASVPGRTSVSAWDGTNGSESCCYYLCVP